MKSLYKIIYLLSPGKYKEYISSQLKYANFSISVEKYIGFSLLYGLSLALVILFILSILNLSKALSLIISILIFLSFQAFMVISPLLIADKRNKIVEEVLPDALQLMAANCRSGLTPDRALFLSARPEFGPLEEEIRRVGKKAMSGVPLEKALKDMTKRISSRVLKRTIDLIIEGINKGGELANLLEQTAEDIRHLKILKREVSSYVAMYAIFIFFAAGIAAPLLFGISIYLVETMVKIGSALPEVTAPTPQVGVFGALRIGKAKISSDFLLFYSISSLSITSIFGSLLIGLVQTGSEKGGIKLIPILLFLNFLIFFAVRTILPKILTIPI